MYIRYTYEYVLSSLTPFIELRIASLTRDYDWNVGTNQKQGKKEYSH